MKNRFRDAPRTLASVLLLLMLASFALAQAPPKPRAPSARKALPPAPDVIAVVDGIAIRQMEWDRLAAPYYQEVEARAGRKLSADEKKLLQKNLLEELIRERLWLADARRRGMAVSEADVDARMKQSAFFRTEGKVDESKFLSFKRSSTSNYPLLSTQVGMGLLIEQYSRWMERRFGPREAEVRKAFQDRTAQATVRYFIVGPEAVSLEPEATARQIRAYYEEHPAEFQTPDSARIQFVRIAIDSAPGDSARDAAAPAALKGANDLLAAIQSGAPVETAAKVYGGLHDTGWFRIADPIRGIGRSEPLQDAIRNAAPGTWIKTPIRNGPNYLVVRVLDRKAPRLQTFREVAGLAKRKADAIVRDGAQDSLGLKEYREHPETYAVPRIRASVLARPLASFADPGPVKPKDVERELKRRREAAKVRKDDRAWIDSVRAELPAAITRERTWRAAAGAMKDAMSRLARREPAERAAQRLGGALTTFDLYRGQPIPAPMLVEGAFLDSLYALRPGAVVGPRVARDSVFAVRIEWVDPAFVPPFEAVRQAANSNALLVRQWSVEKEARAYYDTHPDDYKTKPKWVFDYVFFEKEHPESVAVPESALVAYYHSHPLEFTEPARAKPRIILFQQRPADGTDARAKALRRATDARERIARGESFEAVAEAVSEDRQSGKAGGAVGEVTRGSLLPELADVIFSIPLGEVSDPIEVRTSFHVIRVDERTPERLRSFADSRSEIQKVLGEPLADSLAYAAASRLAEGLAAGGSFDSLTAPLGGAKRSEPIGAGETLLGVGPFESVASDIGALPDGAATPVPVPVGRGYLVARRFGEVAPEPAPFEQMKDRVIQDYLQARRRERADSLDQRLREALARGADLEPLFDAHGGMRVSRPFGRLGPIPDFVNPRDQAVARDSTLLERIFSSRPGAALPPVKSSMGTIYMLVESVSIPPAAEFARRREQIRREIVEERIEAWTARLRSRAEVTIYRKDLRSIAAS